MKASRAGAGFGAGFGGVCAERLLDTVRGMLRRTVLSCQSHVSVMVKPDLHHYANRLWEHCRAQSGALHLYSALGLNHVSRCSEESRRPPLSPQTLDDKLSVSVFLSGVTRALPWLQVSAQGEARRG